MTLIKNESIESRIEKDFVSNRFKKQLINRDKTSNIMLTLLNLCFNLIRKRYKYFETRIKRRLSFLIKMIFMLF